MHDILPDEQKYFRKLYNVCEEIADFYEFKKIETPILEETELFSRGVGVATDIVAKQMFSFRTRGGHRLTLRPEGTAPVVRAYIEHGMQNLPQPVKLWYFGPYFRAEKPQFGRYRQFWQFGFEAMGEPGSVVDAQVIQVFYNVLKELKFKNLIISVNSIGCSQCRPYFKKSLVSYFRKRETSLCADCRIRLKENPLRILDCKEEKCIIVVSQAPQMLDHLCDACRKHFKDILEFFDDLSLPYALNPYLVRGLDYYTKTVFEISEDSEHGKQVGALAGGGRYDGLTKILGGKPTPGCGGAAGMERIIILMKKGKVRFPQPSTAKIFLAQLGELSKRKSLVLIEKFREAGIPVSESLGRDSLKAQLNRANKIGSKYALILGQKETLEGNIIIKDMESGKQGLVSLEKAVEEVKRRLKK